MRLKLEATTAELALASLWRDGAVVLEGAADDNAVRPVAAQLRTSVDLQHQEGPLAQSFGAHALAAQPAVLRNSSGAGLQTTGRVLREMLEKSGARRTTEAQRTWAYVWV